MLVDALQTKLPLAALGFIKNEKGQISNQYSESLERFPWCFSNDTQGGVVSVMCEVQAQFYKHAPDLTVDLNMVKVIEREGEK